MRSEWRQFTLGEVIPFAYGKGLPERNRIVSGTIPVYGSNGIVGYHNRSLTDGPTIIIGRKGTVGAVNYSPVSCWPIDTTFFIYDRDHELVRYWFYLLKSLGLEQMNSDSAVPGLNRNAAYARKVSIPVLKSEQRAIAYILGTLDDKIELNRKMNETLGAMASALFKSWFVDFDPVCAKRDGRWERGESLPGLPAHLYDFFPLNLGETEQGKIPDGWSFSPLMDLTSYFNRGLSPKYTESDGVLVLNQKCVRNNMVDLTKARRHDHTLKGINGRELQLGDILVNSTGVGTLGRVAQILHLSESMIVDSHITVVRAGLLTTPNFLGLELLRRQNEIEAMGEGSTGQTELSRAKLGQLNIVLPPIKLIQQFDSISNQLRNRCSLNILENIKLSSIRDTLLPKLISGQLRIKDACELMEKHA